MTIANNKMNEYQSIPSAYREAYKETAESIPAVRDRLEGLLNCPARELTDEGRDLLYILAVARFGICTAFSPCGRYVFIQDDDANCSVLSANIPLGEMIEEIQSLYELDVIGDSSDINPKLN